MRYNESDRIDRAKETTKDEMHGLWLGQFGAKGRMSNPKPVSRRRFLGAVSVAAAVGVAGCRAPICTASLVTPTNREEDSVASVSSSREGITVNFWDAAGTEENQITEMVFFDASGTERGSVDVPDGAHQVKIELRAYDVENGRGIIRAINSDGDWVGTYEVGVEC